MSPIETNRSWTHFRVDRGNPRYCHVTFDHPPINTITATTVAELSDLVGLIEQDPRLNVVVFDSANRDFYLAHYDLENDPGRTEALGVGPTGLSAWIDAEVEAIASRVARFDHDAIARTKSYVDQVTLPDNSELGPPWNDFLELFRRSAQQPQSARLRGLGLNTDGEFERSLGGRLVKSLPDA
jgi:hypothetical protein